MLKLKLQYFGHLMQSTDSLEKTLILGKIEGGREGDDRGWDGWMASPTQWTWVWEISWSCWWIGKSGMLQSMGLKRVGVDWMTELNWTKAILDSAFEISFSCLLYLFHAHIPNLEVFFFSFLFAVCFEHVFRLSGSARQPRFIFSASCTKRICYLSKVPWFL